MDSLSIRTAVLRVTFAEDKKVTMINLMLGDNDLFDKDGNQRMTASDLLMSVTDVVFSHFSPECLIV